MSHPRPAQAPLPPPLPSISKSFHSQQSRLNLRTNVSPMVRELQAACASSELPFDHKPLAQLGWYFTYGTLMDAALLAEILKIEEEPVFHSAQIRGFCLKLWGQYPALVDGDPEDEIKGVAFWVGEHDHAKRLAEYETRAYKLVECNIELFSNSHGKRERISGFVFKFDGLSHQLKDGHFNLDVWLQRIGRSKTRNIA